MHKRATVSTVALLLVLTIPAFLSPVRGAVTWSSPTPLDQAPGMDILPASLQTSDGTLWVAWQSNRLNPAVFISNIYYRTLSGGVWSSAANLTTPGNNVNHAEPSLAQTFDGTLFLFYAANTTGIYKIYYSTHVASGWSQPVNATSGAMADCSSSATVGKDGTLWLFWTRGLPCSSGNTNIFYKALKNGSWSSEKQLTFDTTLANEPTGAVMNDGRVWVVFSKFVSSTKTQIFDVIYNGTAWSSENQITSSNVFDDHPDIVQDRNGTIWLFWTREVPIGTNLFDDQIFSKYSFDNGATFSADTQITFDPSCCSTDSWGPSAVQSIDHTVWLFFASSQPLGGAFDIYYTDSSPIFPVHKVAVSLITTSPACPFPALAVSSPTCLYPGGMKSVGESSVVTVYVTVTDYGDFSESVTIQLTAVNSTSYSIGSTSGTITPGQAKVFSLVWNTTSTIKPGRYGLLAVVPAVTGESIGNLGNNLLQVSNLVRLIPLGDINQDGDVNILDASVFAYGYSSTIGSPRFNPYADINGNGIIDINDVGVMAYNYGKVT